MKNYESARAEILDWLSDTLHVPVEQIDLTKPLVEVGLDSLDAVHMIATIESIIRQELPEDVIADAIQFGHENVDARIPKIQSLGMALAAIPDDRDGFPFEVL